MTLAMQFWLARSRPIDKLTSFKTNENLVKGI